ncbi:MAG: hypothetical protein LUG91_00080 [Ruminococcus sp.]|nr:hypothetical protein [Ruminococcus sp.]
MVILNGIKNFLLFIENNWTTICVIIGLLIAISKKVYNYFTKSDEEKIEIAKSQIQQTMLKMITEAEVTYEAWNQSGSIKRSQVIEEIFEKYPILSKIANQEEIIEWIDNEIDNSLKTLREIVKSNSVNDDTSSEQTSE